MQAYAPWGCPCAAVIKDGQIHSALCGFGQVKPQDYKKIKLGREAKKELMLQKIPRLLSITDWNGEISSTLYSTCKVSS